MKQTPGSHSSSVSVASCVVDIGTIAYFLKVRPIKGSGPEPDR